HERGGERAPAEAQRLVLVLVAAARALAARRLQRLGRELAELAPVLPREPPELGEAVRERDRGDAGVLAAREKLLSGTRQTHPPNSAERRRSEMEPEMRFERARADAGSRGEGFELDRLV